MLAASGRSHGMRSARCAGTSRPVSCVFKCTKVRTCATDLQTGYSARVIQEYSTKEIYSASICNDIGACVSVPLQATATRARSAISTSVSARNSYLSRQSSLLSLQRHRRHDDRATFNLSGRQGDAVRVLNTPAASDFRYAKHLRARDVGTARRVHNVIYQRQSMITDRYGLMYS